MKYKKVHQPSVSPETSARFSWAKLFLSTLLGTLVVAGCLISAATAQAQQVNVLYFPLTNAPGVSTTNFPSSTSLGGLSANLAGFNGSGALKDLEGIAGSAVNGSVNGFAAMSATNGDTGNATQSANANGAANCAADLGDPNLNLGTVHDFMVTFWFKEPIVYSDSSGNTLPRLFVLSNGGSPGENDDSANSIGLKFQLGDQFEFEINNPSTTTGNSYNAPANTASLGTTLGSDLLPNKWYFVAWVYDNTNLYQYTGSDTAVATLQNQEAAQGLSVNLGNPSTLVVANRSWKASRGFFGSMEDFRFYTNVASAGNNAGFVESIRKQIAPAVPIFTGIYPNGTGIMETTNTFVFTAQSSSGFNLTNIDLKVNNIDVTASCSFVTNGTGSTNVSVSYTGLPQQVVANTAVMSATDALGLTGTTTATFDTFNPTNFTIKAEEFDYGGGLFIDNPDYTDGNPADPNSYYGLSSMEGIDTHKGPSVGDNTTDYRYDGDTPAGSDTQTPLAVGELSVPRIANAPLDGGGNPQQNHVINQWSSGEWQNYTKTFPAGNYNVYARLATGSGSTVVFDQVTGGQGSVNQTLNQLGTFTLTGSSQSSFQWVPLMNNGTLAVVNLSGVNTVRATSGGGAIADLYMFVSANPSLPVISNVHPDGSVLFQNTNQLTFTISSTTTTINTSNIHVSLNGVDVSGSLAFTGNSTSWNVSYTGLQPNQTYVTSINVTDNNGGVAGAQLTIDTWTPLLQFEAEDFDFDPTLSPISAGNGLRFIDNPVPTSIATAAGVYKVTATNSYEGQTGDEQIDQFGVGAGTRVYRPGDVATTVVTDTPRAQFAGHQDFNIGFLGAGFWEDYTRTWPAGTYNLYGRMASGASQSGLPTPPGIRDDVDLIDVGADTANQVISYVGTFNIPTTNGYSAYTYVPLLDKFGNYANVTLNGVETLRSTLDLTTTAGLPQFGLNANFYMLVAPRTDLPRIDAVYPDGTMQQTSTFAFVASNPTYGIATNNIQVTLNGVNISTNLVFSGSSGSWNVSYPGLQPNTTYTATITITDNNNQTHSTTVTFDTFSQSNFTWEAEDFDFDPTLSPVPAGNGLRYIDNPVLTNGPATNGYFGQTGDSGIDESPLFQGILGTYIYRGVSDYVSTEVTSDVLRQKYLNAQIQSVDPNIVDYDVDFYTNWIDYTRTFPAGNYLVFARLSAGAGAFNMQCAQITFGAGTTMQTSNVLGNFIGSGTSFATWQYVPLTNAATGSLVILSLGGVETLQMTGDANENANYFMLVPLTATLKAAVSGSSDILSFPTMSGLNYTVYYKNNLTDPGWTQLGSMVPGNGMVMSVTDSNILLSQSHRFYRLSVQ
jgi:hypothetical protein